MKRTAFTNAIPLLANAILICKLEADSFGLRPNLTTAAMARLRSWPPFADQIARVRIHEQAVPSAGRRAPRRQPLRSSVVMTREPNVVEFKHLRHRGIAAGAALSGRRPSWLRTPAPAVFEPAPAAAPIRHVNGGKIAARIRAWACGSRAFRSRPPSQLRRAATARSAISRPGSKFPSRPIRLVVASRQAAHSTREAAHWRPG
jgi:hypothetical protein